MWSDCATGVQVATSTDGIHWSTVGQASGLTNPRHTVVEKIGSGYRMWYNDNGWTSISDLRTATSTDGIHWTGDQVLTQVGTSVVTGSGNSSDWHYGTYGPNDVLYNPSGSASIVAPVDKASVWANRYIMYYDGSSGNMEATGLAVSNDGINWEGYNGGVNPVLQGSGGTAWDKDYATRGTVIEENANLFYMWYSGGSGAMNQGIGFATSTDGINWTKALAPIFDHNDVGATWRNDRTYTPMVIGDQMWFTGKDLATGTYAIGYASEAPEPATITMLALGVGGIAMLTRRRKMQRQLSA